MISRWLDRCHRRMHGRWLRVCPNGSHATTVTGLNSTHLMGVHVVINRLLDLGAFSKFAALLLRLMRVGLMAEAVRSSKHVYGK